MTEVWEALLHIFLLLPFPFLSWVYIILPLGFLESFDMYHFPVSTCTQGAVFNGLGLVWKKMERRTLCEFMCVCGMGVGFFEGEPNHIYCFFYLRSDSVNSLSTLIFWFAQVSCQGFDYFPKTAVTNDHKRGGSRQKKCILSQLWGLEIWNPVGPHRSPSMPLPASGGCRHSWAAGRTPPNLPLNSVSFAESLCGILLCLYLIRTLVMAFRPSQRTRAHCISGSLSSSHLQRSFFQIR